MSEENEGVREIMDELYNSIKEANEAMAIVREQCTHNKTKEGKYMWRPGTIVDVEMCIHCDEVIKSLDDNLETTITTATVDVD